MMTKDAKSESRKKSRRKSLGAKHTRNGALQRFLSIPKDPFWILISRHVENISCEYWSVDAADREAKAPADNDGGFSWLKAGLKFIVDSAWNMKRPKVPFRLRDCRACARIKHPRLSSSIGKLRAFAPLMRIQIRDIRVFSSPSPLYM